MASDDTVKRYDCTSGGSKFCQGCYTMTECEYGDYVAWEDFDAMRQRAEKAELEAERLLEEHDKAWRHAGMNLENLSAAVVRIDLLEDLLRDALFVFQVCASCQHGVLPKCRCEKCVRQRIDAALAKQAKP